MNPYPYRPPQEPKTYTIDGKEVLKEQKSKEGTSGTEVFDTATRQLTEPKLPPNVIPR